MRIKNTLGFTLAEVLLVIAILGIIAAMTLPTLKSSIPSKYEALHKKCDYVLETVVSEIVNNEDYYEALKTVTNDPSDPSGESKITTITHGIQNTHKVEIDGETFEGNTKFCKLVAHRFKIMPGTAINCTTTAGFKEDGKTPTFISTDGVQWLIPVSDFQSDKTISFKTSTDGRGPNCAFVKSNPNSCPEPDIFVYTITKEGRLYKDVASSSKLQMK